MARVIVPVEGVIFHRCVAVVVVAVDVADVADVADVVFVVVTDANVVVLFCSSLFFCSFL